MDLLRELERNEADQNVLAQSTKFRERCFLSEKKERQNILKLLSEVGTSLDFVETSEMNSDNGKLIVELGKQSNLKGRQMLIKISKRLMAAARNRKVDVSLI